MLDRFSKFAPLVLRTAVAVVFLWFGFSQLANPSGWTRMIPSYASFIPLTQVNLIYAHGVFEIIFATCLLLGLHTRLAALLLTVNLAHITYIVGYGPIGARDFALAMACFTIFLNGADDYTLDSIKKK